MKKLSDYQTWFFDCDGVILDANQLKQAAFYEVALLYGKKNAEQFKEYQKRSGGGISRYKKFQFFFETILQLAHYQDELEQAVKLFGEITYKKMLTCPETIGFQKFMQTLPKESKKYVVSGGRQEELRQIFKERGLTALFNDIHGSPDSKEVILKNKIKAGELIFPAIFIGDGQYDYEMAMQFKLDFIFLSGYTETKEWQNNLKNQDNIIITDNLNSLLKIYPD